MPRRGVINKLVLSGRGTTRIQLRSLLNTSSTNVFTGQQTGMAQQKESWCWGILAGCGGPGQSSRHSPFKPGQRLLPQSFCLLSLPPNYFFSR